MSQIETLAVGAGALTFVLSQRERNKSGQTDA
jgi:hypothetical protein